MAIGKGKIATSSPSTVGTTLKNGSSTETDNKLTVKKVRTSAKKYMPKSVKAAQGPTKIVKQTRSGIKAVNTAESRAATKESLASKWDNYKKESAKKIQESAKKRGENMITKGLDPLIAAGITKAVAMVSEPTLLGTIQLLCKNDKVDPLYNNGYCIKQFLKRDFSRIVEWLIDNYKYNVCAGKDAKYFNATNYGATKSSIIILKKKAGIKGDQWYQANRYFEIKQIIKKCSINFKASDIENLLEYGAKNASQNANFIGAVTGGLTIDGRVDSPIYKTDKDGNSTRTYMRKVLPSGYGDEGCDEFKKKYLFTKGDINAIFPEKDEPNFGKWKVTYPKTKEHVTLFKDLMNESKYGVDKLVSPEIHRRLYDNQIYDPIVNEALGLANDVLKDTGLDKVVSAATNQESLMYLYVKWLVDEKYI